MQMMDALWLVQLINTTSFVTVSMCAARENQLAERELTPINIGLSRKQLLLCAAAFRMRTGRKQSGQRAHGGRAAAAAAVALVRYVATAGQQQRNNYI